MHYVSCVNHCPPVVVVGCGDGRVLLADPRTGGIVQSHKGPLESITTLTPGSSESFHVACTDSYGMVDIWDVRVQHSRSFQLGRDRDESPSERLPVVCSVLPHRGLIASTKIPSHQEVMLSELSSGRLKHTFPLDVQPFTMGYHPTRDTFGVFAHRGEAS